MPTDLSRVKYKNGSTWTQINPFPVGFIYLSYKNTSPGSIYGGTWEPMTSNRYLRLGGNFSTGGSDTHTHNLNDYAKAAIMMGTAGDIYCRMMSSNSTAWAYNRRLVQAGTVSDNSANVTTGTQIIGHTNASEKTELPSYQNVYAWRRTA